MIFNSGTPKRILEEKKQKLGGDSTKIAEKASDVQWYSLPLSLIECDDENGSRTE